MLQISTGDVTELDQIIDLFANGIDEIHMTARDSTVKIVCDMGGKIVGEPYKFYDGNVTPIVLRKDNFRI